MNKQSWVAAKIKRKISSINLTAEDWQLYTATMSSACAPVAKKLNAKLKVLINTKGNSYEDVKKQMMEYMALFQEYGASDTEPRNVLLDVLDYLWGINQAR